ncbi:TRIC cation channel family protein [Eggerthellaceae bacterium 24-137]
MLETAFTLPFWFEFAATVTGGLSGGMSAVRARYDIFGTVAIACITGMGGGIIRDVLLQNYGLYAFQSPWFLLSCAVAGVVVFYFGKLATYLDPIVDLLDNISVALWAIIGASKSLSAGLGIIPSVVLGTITAIGGGISRDVLMNRSPVAFQAGPIYGSAALIGCIVYCPLKANGILPNSAGFLCAMLIMGLRYLSLILGWRTKPPRDYSDRVVESVVRPARFIARKVHVPMGKTARERQGNTRLERFKRQGKRLYNRLSGRWMDETAEQFEPTVLMDKLELPIVGAEKVAAGGAGDQASEAPSPEPDPSDRIVVDRDELYRIIGLDPNPEPEAEPDPFEPQTPEPVRHQSKSQVRAGNPRKRKEAAPKEKAPSKPEDAKGESANDPKE